MAVLLINATPANLHKHKSQSSPQHCSNNKHCYFSHNMEGTEEMSRHIFYINTQSYTANTDKNISPELSCLMAISLASLLTGVPGAKPWSRPPSVT